jgi:rod shape-determining protein MreB and related proteins
MIAKNCRAGHGRSYPHTGEGRSGLLHGLDERLREETGLPIHLAENPLESVVLGAGKYVEDFDALQQVLVPQRRR